MHVTCYNNKRYHAHFVALCRVNITSELETAEELMLNKGHQSVKVSELFLYFK